MGGARWSEEEKRTLADIANEGKTLSSQMHRLPGRSFESAKTYASRLGIAFSDAAAWSEEEQNVLRRIYRGKQSIKLAVARRLAHRGYAAARREAQRLGLAGKPRRAKRTGYPWIERAIATLFEDDVRRTCRQIASAAGMSVTSVNRVMRQHLGDVPGKKFRVAAWRRPSGIGRWEAMWELGSDPDEPKPQRKTPSELCRAHRLRQRARDGEIDPFASIIRQVSGVGGEGTLRAIR